ncbi:DUF3515 family protein [Leucobacter sp. wl10]|uniref:DUF3515 family protein n=1 Tax=Leucobacter sp. wl10 TaxID=2304677 RepID=UPI001F08A6FE|nr:DUF3515 family protein [Leucobacter sp. wl10]
MKTSAPRLLAPTAAVAGAALLLTACSGSVPMEAAENADDPACTDVIAQLPSQVAGLDRRATSARSTGAWGDPAAVQLQCGVEPSGPTTDPCLTVNGVDWVADESAAPITRFEAYGRSPGLAIFVDSKQVNGTDAIIDLGPIAQLLPQQRQCTSPASQ